MRKLIATAVVAIAFLSSGIGAQQLGETLPAIEAVKWYNTPPLALEQLQGKAILLEVFRTW